MARKLRNIFLVQHELMLFILIQIIWGVAMVGPDTTLEIQTLGRFKILADGKPVATDWPNEALKTCFCSLLSPMDISFTWDRICRSLLDVPVTRGNRRKLDEKIILPLNSFLLSELGFNPLINEKESIRINLQGIQIDAHEFYSSALEGMRLMSNSNDVAALNKFNRANSLYAGAFLLGMPGKIIENARHDLDMLYRAAVKPPLLLVAKLG